MDALSAVVMDISGVSADVSPASDDASPVSAADASPLSADASPTPSLSATASSSAASTGRDRGSAAPVPPLSAPFRGARPRTRSTRANAAASGSTIPRHGSRRAAPGDPTTLGPSAGTVSCAGPWTGGSSGRAARTASAKPSGTCVSSTCGKAARIARASSRYARHCSHPSRCVRTRSASSSESSPSRNASSRAVYPSWVSISQPSFPYSLDGAGAGKFPLRRRILRRRPRARLIRDFTVPMSRERACPISS